MVTTFLRWICSTLSTINIGLDVDSTYMFGSYPLKKILVTGVFDKMKKLNGERAFILNR